MHPCASANSHTRWFVFVWLQPAGEEVSHPSARDALFTPLGANCVACKCISEKVHVEKCIIIFA